MNTIHIVVFGFFVSFIAACSQGAGKAGAIEKPAAGGKETSAEKTEGGPVTAEVSAKGPVGLFFMTRYWSFTNSLEKAAWYFSPEGDVYRNLRRDFRKRTLRRTS